MDRCLGYYESIKTTISWEILVVDNGSTDDTAAVLERYRSRATLSLVALEESARGVSRGRNAGLHHARGDIICFSDDDCYPDPHFINAWQRVFRDPTIDFAGGRIELFDPSDANFTLKTDLVSCRFPPNGLILPGALHGASLAFRHDVVARIGGFDTALGPGTRFRSAEDSEYVQRASAHGYSGQYSPDPLVWHHHGRKPADIPALSIGYEIGRGAFYASVLLRSPGLLPRAILNDFRESLGLLAYVRSLYWRNYRRFPQRVWNISRGTIGFAAVLMWRWLERAATSHMPGKKAL